MKFRGIAKKSVVVEVKSVVVARYYERMTNAEIEESLKGLKMLKDYKINKILTVNTVNNTLSIEMVRR